MVLQLFLLQQEDEADSLLQLPSPAVSKKSYSTLYPDGPYLELTATTCNSNNRIILHVITVQCCNNVHVTRYAAETSDDDEMYYSGPEEDSSDIDY